MSDLHEVEVKFRVRVISDLEAALHGARFTEKTPPTHEINALYDRNGGELHKRGELLRLRNYGGNWKLTHKSKGNAGGKHKSRVERETAVADGGALHFILLALGFAPTFQYEKFRSEWTDGYGEVVIDRTPVGDIAEIEGAPEWIDMTAQKLGVSEQDYIVSSYADIFFEWKQKTGSTAENMTFAECGVEPPKR